jgi:hypothetical protein
MTKRSIKVIGYVRATAKHGDLPRYVAIMGKGDVLREGYDHSDSYVYVMNDAGECCTHLGEKNESSLAYLTKIGLNHWQQCELFSYDGPYSGLDGYIGELSRKGMKIKERRPNEYTNFAMFYDLGVDLK